MLLKHGVDNYLISRFTHPHTLQRHTRWHQTDIHSTKHF